jgi:hypothetical protein
VYLYVLGGVVAACVVGSLPGAWCNRVGYVLAQVVCVCFCVFVRVSRFNFFMIAKISNSKKAVVFVDDEGRLFTVPREAFVEFCRLETGYPFFRMSQLVDDGGEILTDPNRFGRSAAFNVDSGEVEDWDEVDESNREARRTDALAKKSRERREKMDKYNGDFGF